LSYNISVTGLIQGVGFRPFVYRTANQFHLDGYVRNTNENVVIVVSGNENDIQQFVTALKNEKPRAAVIDEIVIVQTDEFLQSGFSIVPSDNISEEITEVSPDIAVCPDCVSDMEKQPHRLEYPMINCTNCGPRFTIIKDLPYDRAKTTMDEFNMCGICTEEYNNVADRRFHAQPVACNNCGPTYSLFVNRKLITGNIQDLVYSTAKYIDEGGIILLKGLGGMHLACDAFNPRAVARLRDLKMREGKPFAVMFRDLVSARSYAKLGQEEEGALLSWRRPIVLADRKNDTHFPPLTSSITSGLGLIGIMLPYMPFHYLLFRKLGTDAIVLTSGNFSSEPIITGNDEALSLFSDKVDAVVLHNREIWNRTDDSVVRIMDGKERIFRRSRGYVPAPVRVTLNADGIIAFGAELTNCFCAGKGRKAFMSQHIGDLQNMETTLFYEESLSRFMRLFRIRPSLLVTDMHPDYISSRAADKYEGIPVVAVQHHHAHIASCLAENGLDELVIGVAFDGTGYGTDGNIWGSEFMICDLNDFRRISHFEYIELPGGDMAAEEPWRVAVAWLYRIFGPGWSDLDIPVVRECDPEKCRMITIMIDKGINSPLTSGAGRLFDAVASLAGIVHTASFQAEGPMKLEALATASTGESYPFTAGNVIGLRDTVRAIVEDLLAGRDKMTIATKLHNTIIMIIFDTVVSIRKQEGISKVALSGGVFQNSVLLTGVLKKLREDNFEVFTHAALPSNDGGISLGQLAVAAKRRELKCV
jgi:hydrogenase maturation protein HypF